MHELSIAESIIELTVEEAKKRLGVPAHQITTGSVCHLDARMVRKAITESRASA
jgi:Ni2+-binding GTPase involved in maturation of urease and hydrogenase